jgi:hypothetical protein
LNLAILYETGEGSYTVPERKLALIHRVIVPDEDYPKEYAILVTDRHSIFIRLKKTRSSFVLRQEMRIGTALVTDVIPKTLEDYGQTSLQTLESDSQNLTVPHEDVASLAMRADELVHRKRDFFVWVVMKRQKEIFQVYNFDMNYRDNLEHEKTVRFYAVPLGAYFKPRRQTQTRERILRDYAMDTLEIFGRVLPARVISP